MKICPAMSLTCHDTWNFLATFWLQFSPCTNSDTFTRIVDQTQSCMQLLREIADEFPEDVRSVVKDGAKARKPQTYAAYLVNLQRESDRAWAAEHSPDVDDAMEVV